MEGQEKWTRRLDERALYFKTWSNSNDYVLRCTVLEMRMFFVSKMNNTRAAGVTRYRGSFCCSFPFMEKKRERRAVGVGPPCLKSGNDLLNMSLVLSKTNYFPHSESLVYIP